MSDTISTSSIALSWATKRMRNQDWPQTEFFLFPEEEGRVVVRGPADKSQPELERTRPATSLPASTEARDKGSMPAKQARVPQTKLISSRPDQRYILLKKFEGFVTARHKDSFSARLFESSSDYPVLEAEFDFDELSETDRELVVEGASMVWTIGYVYHGSTRKRESLIYLRRLPAWSEKEIEEARKAADDLTRAIRWE